MEIDFNKDTHLNNLTIILDSLHVSFENKFKIEERNTLFLMENDLRNQFASLLNYAEQENIDAKIVQEKGSEIENSIQNIEDYLEAISY